MQLHAAIISLTKEKKCSILTNKIGDMSKIVTYKQRKSSEPIIIPDKIEFQEHNNSYKGWHGNKE